IQEDPQKRSLQMEKDRMIHDVTAEKIVSAVGRKANTKQIGLQNTEVETKDGYIVTNEMFQTNESHIDAIGDCIGGMQLAHVASNEVIIAVEHMSKQSPLSLNSLHLQNCVYSYPEIARISMTEEQAKTT